MAKTLKPFIASVTVDAFSVNCPVCQHEFSSPGGSLMWSTAEVDRDDPPDLHCPACKRDIDLPMWAFG